MVELQNKVTFDGLAAYLFAACAVRDAGHGRKPDWIVVYIASHHWLPHIADDDHKARTIVVWCMHAHVGDFGL
ncbi:hypothetical protein PR202_gb12612 [Eleusine coracana subsp. coracana]|uniref:Uncharacterized protein n=1 Tax=Eleusine coracana subsp. coracana TaxID=191504 RepID=A0AAV5EQQ9_ELECO|nr:hypothetical protein PR202_gb12612 [Eleusine coracana subsp. coracana]